jgi:septation ring formation regulator EzrA
MFKKASDNKTILNAETERAATNYLIAQTSAHTDKSFALLERIRISVEKGDYPEARKGLEEVEKSIHVMRNTLAHVAVSQGRPLFTEDEISKSVRNSEKLADPHDIDHDI